MERGEGVSKQGREGRLREIDEGKRGGGKKGREGGTDCVSAVVGLRVRERVGHGWTERERERERER